MAPISPRIEKDLVVDSVEKTGKARKDKQEGQSKFGIRHFFVSQWQHDGGAG